MNIIINAVLAFEQPRGVGRYLNELIPALAKYDQENQYYIYYGSWMTKYRFTSVKQKNFHLIKLNISRNQILRNLYLCIALPKKIKKLHPDLYFLPDTQATLIKPCKIISTIHDIMEFDFPEKYPKIRAKIRRMIIRRQCKISDKIITVSNFSKEEIMHYLNIPKEKITVIYNSVSTETFSGIIAQPDNYFLYVSETEKAKNAMILLQAFALLQEDIKNQFHIKIVGKKGNQYEDLISFISNNHLEDKVRFYGYVTDQELNELYSKAYAFVFPSLFEGFGLPIIEAMAKGVPVLCSDRASLPEIGGDAVITFDPLRQDDLAEKLMTLVQKPQQRDLMIYLGKKRVAQFTVNKQIEGMLSIFKEVINGR